jgi:polo-like kinase 1
MVEERVKHPNGEISYRQYVKGKFLGKGGFAMCYEFVQCDSKQVSAAKVIQKASLQRSRAKQKLMSEIKIHRSVKHQNIA